MSYAVPSDVIMLFRNLDTTLSDPALSDANIQALLDDASNIIDAKISALYQLPINVTDNPLSWSILKKLETYYVASEVDDVLNTYAEAEKKPEWGKKAKKLMEELVPPKDKKGMQPEPLMKLPDATYLGTKQQRNKIAVSATSGRTFEKGGLNW